VKGQVVDQLSSDEIYLVSYQQIHLFQYRAKQEGASLCSGSYNTACSWQMEAQEVHSHLPISR
jgi:hypothetical protein